ncbi:Serine/threonine-protein kinase PknB [Neorhodopirellula pilleata]|uniref:non-specific serine/threonine protein kinase n=2 Tax=Neorhodopirellula pilleata TaxID=2714738 RepID=A0A5C6AAH7_9BACT|nr:Serine/threonine-protein kinase PknB [Neorhodopirellula pilleata]
MIDCPPQDSLEAFVQDEIGWGNHDEIQSHIETCPRCQLVLENHVENADANVLVRRVIHNCNAKSGVLGEWNQSRVERVAKALLMNDQPTIKKELAEFPTINGYDVERVLGRGGMGIVLKARHQRMRRDVAIKVLPETAFRDPASVDRFYREVQAVAQLSHPHIVAAYDAGEQDEIHYFVMEYIQGQDLEKIVKQLGPLAVEDAVECIIQAAKGLEYAHDRGIIHRDIKPANLLLQQNGIIKVLDMGLARRNDVNPDANEEDAQLTQVGQIMGTVDFMAPEQALDTRSADARADVYSLGCTMYCLLNGERPYHGDTMMKKILSHREDAIPSLSQKRADVPRALDAIFSKMVAKTPDDRYQTMSEVITDLLSFRDQDVTLGVPNLVGLPERADLASAKQGDRRSESYAETQMCVGSASTLTEDQSLAFVDPPSADPAASETVDPSRRTVSAGNDRFTSWPWIVASAGGFSLLLAAILMFIQTPHGLLRIEIDDPSIKVSVGGDDRLRVTADQGEFEIAPGEHHLQIKVGDVSFQTNEFTLGQGETIALRITMVENQKVQIIRDGTPIEEHLISPLPESSPDNDALAASKMSSSQEIPQSQKLPSDREPIPVLTDVYPGKHALRFTERNESYVEFPTLTASVEWNQIRPTMVYTLELWIQRDRQEMDAHENYIGIDHWSITSGSGAGYIENGEVGGRGAPPIRFRGIHGPLWHQEQASHWMHIAAIDEIDKQRRLYLNGKLVGTEPSTMDWGAGGGGKWDSTVRLGGSMVGSIGEARISTIARYQDNFSPEFEMKTDEHTLALYRVDEGSGDVLHDSSGNEHHGTIVNAQWQTSSGK